jgi:hypothetical protein
MYPIWAPLMNLADRGPASHPSCRWSTFGDTPMYTRMMPNWRWSWIRLGNCGVRLLAHRSIGRLLGTDQGYSDLCALLPVGWAGLRRAVSRADEKCLSSTCGQVWTEYSFLFIRRPSRDAAGGCTGHRTPKPFQREVIRAGLDYAEEGHLSVHHIIQPYGLVSWPWNILYGSPEQSKNILLLFIH